METLKDIFVPYEIAVQLKEIGFYEPCMAMYNQRKEIEIGLNEVVKQANFVRQDLLLVSDFNEINSHHIGSKPFCSAPTYEQVKKWFREKGVESSLFTEDGYYYYRGSKGDKFLFSGTEDTYKQAQEQLIYKLIEIYKNECKR
ncbi:hypothetical protein [Capnocytophaga canis]|uniref:hypothetical protein n=1 Tax=Capnocytophaga canis TaxID=1848903 RepID=UPI0037D5D9AE